MLLLISQMMRRKLEDNNLRFTLTTSRTKISPLVVQVLPITLRLPNIQQHKSHSTQVPGEGEAGTAMSPFCPARVVFSCPHPPDTNPPFTAIQLLLPQLCCPESVCPWLYLIVHLESFNLMFHVYIHCPNKLVSQDNYYLIIYLIFSTMLNAD
jgi:hypothetical protein